MVPDKEERYMLCCSRNIFGRADEFRIPPKCNTHFRMLPSF